MPKYCRAPNCSNTAGRLGADNRPVSFYKFPLKDGPRLQAWLRCMGCEHWVPSCHQHLCSEHFTPSCFQWRWGVRYLRPDAVPSIFSRAPPAKSQRGTRSTKKRVVPLPPQEATPQPPGRAIAAPGPVHLVVLGPAAGTPEAAATMLLPALPTSPTLAGPRPDVPAQQAGAGLGAALGALQRRVRRLQRRHQRHQVQLRALEQLAQQLLAQARRGLQRVMKKRRHRAVQLLAQSQAANNLQSQSSKLRGLAPEAARVLLESSLPGPYRA